MKKKYEEAITKAKELAQQGYLVTFGIKPSEAHTGYGYIEAEMLLNFMKSQILE
nr:sugar phosphate nucleotidyltransferase [Lebetimonas sp. JS138]